MIIDLFNVEDHGQVRMVLKFQRCVKMAAIVTSLTAIKISPENGKSTEVDNNSAAENSSTPTAIDGLWRRTI